MALAYSIKLKPHITTSLHTIKHSLFEAQLPHTKHEKVGRVKHDTVKSVSGFSVLNQKGKKT